MTPTDIFRLYVLVEKPITIILPSKKVADKLYAQLRVAKSRHSQSMKDLGMSGVDNLIDKAIRMEPTAEQPANCYQVTISVVPVKRTVIDFTLSMPEMPSL